MIHKITMPKWGLSMEEGKVVAWLFDDGTEVEAGSEICEVETEKIASGLETPSAGVLRRVAKVGDVVPVAGLVAVIAEPSAPASEVDAFISEFQASFVPPSPSVEADSPQPQTVELGGRILQYLKLGEGGDPAILVHGFGGDLNNWLFNHEVLSADRAVYALDLPGHGGSVKEVGAGTLDDLSAALGAFMDALEIPKAHVVGHSLGGAVALAFALEHPNRAASLGLLASAGLGSEINGGYIQGFITEGRRRGLKPHLEKLFARPSLVTRQFVDDVLRNKRLDGVEACLRTIAGQAFADGRQARVMRDRLGELSCPVLVLWGARDQILPVSHAEGLPANITVSVIPEAGHMVQMEAAGEVNQALVSLWG